MHVIFTHKIVIFILLLLSVKYCTVLYFKYTTHHKSDFLNPLTIKRQYPSHVFTYSVSSEHRVNHTVSEIQKKYLLFMGNTLTDCSCSLEAILYIC